jgi:hypothetical protein
MTTMIDVYYGKPPKLLDLPNCVSMSHAAFRFYDCLWGLSDRRSSLQVDATDEDIIKRTTLSKGTLAIVRKDLIKRGLIICHRQQRGYRYSLCDPMTPGQPYPGNPKVKIKYEKKTSSHKTPVERQQEPLTEVAATIHAATHTGKDLPDEDFIPATHQSTPQLIPQQPIRQRTLHTLHTLPLRPDGERDYGFDKLFGNSNG